MAGNYLTNLFDSLMGKEPKASPYSEVGVSGTPIYGGYVATAEKSAKLTGTQRYVTASDIMANVSIAAAGIRFFATLAAQPSWTVTPAEDMPDGKSSDAAKKAAEFMQSVLDGLDTNWTRIVRRSSMYRYHGFGIGEWTARRQPDGMIGMADIEPRPQHTIEQWARDEGGSIVAMGQRSPQNGDLLWIPRSKTIYLVDDTLTDSPEGMGLFRHLVEPAERIKKYLLLEGQGFERDLRGIPVGRAPYAAINAAVAANKLTAAQAATLTDAIEKFVKLQVKNESTGIVLDSKTYEGVTGDGVTVSGALQWGLDLLTGSATSIGDLGSAIERETQNMALILGVESLLIGASTRGGSGGSRALSEDKSRHIYLNVNSCLNDMAEGYTRDFVGAVWTLNGLPDELKPKLDVEDASYKDAGLIATTLRDMSVAGAVLAPDDPIINEVRDLLGTSHQPEHAALMSQFLTPPPAGAPGADQTASGAAPPPGTAGAVPAPKAPGAA